MNSALQTTLGSWVFLFGAIVFEVTGTTCMKLSAGFSQLLPSLSMGICYALSFTLLNLALKHIEIGIAYAIWSGLGTVLIACIGITRFNEHVSVLKIISLALVVLGVIGLKASLRTS